MRISPPKTDAPYDLEFMKKVWLACKEGNRLTSTTEVTSRYAKPINFDLYKLRLLTTVLRNRKQKALFKIRWKNAVRKSKRENIEIESSFTITAPDGRVVFNSAKNT